MDNLFVELALILVLAGVSSLVVSFFKQPSVIGYIIAGVLLSTFGIVHGHDSTALHALSQVGITLLLFMVGLELDVTQLKKIGRRAVIAGAAQILVTTAAGLLIGLLLGFSLIVSAYIALALTFSSTIIVVKLLAEKRDLQSLYGRLSIGILLAQDLVALIILMVLAGGGNSGLEIPLWGQILLTALKAAGLGLVIAALNSFIFPRLLKVVGKSDELLLIFSLGWALGFAVLVQLPMIGFSLEIGGFLAGIALSGSSVQHEISARIRSLRDFFIMLFFIILGSQISFAGIGSVLLPALFLSLFVLIGKPLIVLTTLGLLGYKQRTSFFAAQTLGQISEFGLILVALGSKLGSVPESVSSLITLVAIITIALSSFSIVQTERIYSWLATMLDWFDFTGGTAEKHQRVSELRNHIVLLGAHRTGYELAESFIKHREKFVIIDFNPDVAEHYSHLGVQVICGDASDPYIQELAGFEHARMIVSTLPDMHDNLAVAESARNQKLKAKIIVMAQNEADARSLYKHKVDYVLLPHYINGIHLARILKHPHPHQHLTSLRKQHLHALGA